MLLTRDESIPIAFVAFDVLSLDGENVMGKPYYQPLPYPSCEATTAEDTSSMIKRGFVASLSPRP